MLSWRFTMKGLLSVHDAAKPPSQTEPRFGSLSFLPVRVSHDNVGAFTLPLFGQEQLGLQQSQYPVVHVPRTQLPGPSIGGAGVSDCDGVGTATGVGDDIGAGIS